MFLRCSAARCADVELRYGCSFWIRSGAPARSCNTMYPEATEMFDNCTLCGPSHHLYVVRPHGTHTGPSLPPRSPPLLCTSDAGTVLKLPSRAERASEKHCDLSRELKIQVLRGQCKMLDMIKDLAIPHPMREDSSPRSYHPSSGQGHVLLNLVHFC